MSLSRLESERVRPGISTSPRLEGAARSTVADVRSLTRGRFAHRRGGNAPGMSTWRRHFSGGADAAREARRVVREWLSRELPGGRLDDVELLVSELATNSVRHGGAGTGT